MIFAKWDYLEKYYNNTVFIMSINLSKNKIDWSDFAKSHHLKKYVSIHLFIFITTHWFDLVKLCLLEKYFRSGFAGVKK